MGSRGVHCVLLHRHRKGTAILTCVCITLVATFQSSLQTPAVDVFVVPPSRQSRSRRVPVAAGPPLSPSKSPWNPSLGPLDGVVDEQLTKLKDVAESEVGRNIASLFGAERFESVKTSVLAVGFGAVPEAITAWLDPDRLTPRWEFQLDMLALQILLFGLVYRYAVREGDNNPHQSWGVLSAFVLPRALFLVDLPSDCTPAPLSCGTPLGYFNWAMLAQAVKQVALGGAALGGALYGLERGFSVGLVRRFSGLANDAKI